MTAPDFRTPPSPHTSYPGEPPQLWPLDDPDYYRREQRPPYGAGIVLAIPIGFALWALAVWLVLG
jgi:hypothetical protein